MTPEQYETLLRVERKLDALIAALADEDEEPPSRTLDGEIAGGERDQGMSLG